MYHCDLAEAHARFTQLRSNSELVSDSFLWNLWILFPPNNVCVSGQKYSKYFSYGVMLKPLHSLSDFPPRKVGNQIPCGRWRPRYEPEPRWVVFAAGSGIFPRRIWPNRALTQGSESDFNQQFTNTKLLPRIFRTSDRAWSQPGGGDTKQEREGLQKPPSVDLNPKVPSPPQCGISKLDYRNETRY